MAGWLALELNGLWLIWGLIVLGFACLPSIYNGLLRREQIPAESATSSPPLKLKYILYPPLLIIAFYQIVGYMLEGTFQGLAAAVLAVMVLVIAFLVLRHYVDGSVAALTGIEATFLSPGTLVSLVLAGGLIGAAGSALSLRRYLAV